MESAEHPSSAKKPELPEEDNGHAHLYYIMEEAITANAINYGIPCRQTELNKEK